MKFIIEHKKADDASASAMSRMTGGMGGFPF